MKIGRFEKRIALSEKKTPLAPMGGTALSHKNIFHSSFGPFEIVEVKKRKEKKSFHSYVGL